MKPLLIRFLLFLLIMPLFSILYLSVQQQWAFPALFNLPTAQHWHRLWQEEVGSSFLLSIVLASIIGLLSTLFGFFASKAIAFRPKAIANFRWAYYPYLIAPVVFGAMLQFYFVRLGLLGSFLGVLLAQSLYIFPYAIILWATFWNENLQKLGQQAATLGASERYTLRYVYFPVAKSWFGLSFVQCFMVSWFEYGITQVIGVGKVQTLTLKSVQFVNEANPHLAAVVSCLMVLPMLILWAFNRKWLMRPQV